MEPVLKAAWELLAERWQLSAPKFSHSSTHPSGALQWSCLTRCPPDALQIRLLHHPRLARTYSSTTRRQQVSLSSRLLHWGILTSGKSTHQWNFHLWWHPQQIRSRSLSTCKDRGREWVLQFHQHRDWWSRGGRVLQHRRRRCLHHS